MLSFGDQIVTIPDMLEQVISTGSWQWSLQAIRWKWYVLLPDASHVVENSIHKTWTYTLQTMKCVFT